MPFKSDKQRKFMYAKHPAIAKRWSREREHRMAPQQGNMPPWLKKKTEESSNNGSDDSSKKMNAIERRLQMRNKNKKKAGNK